MPKQNRRVTLAIVITAITIALGIPTVALATSNPWGTPSNVPASGTQTNTLTFADGTTATLTATNVKEIVNGAQAMNQGTALGPTPLSCGSTTYGNWWGGVGDYTSAFTPASLNCQTGLTVGWKSGSSQAGLCSSVTTVTPGTPTKCPTSATVTYTFSREVSNVVLNLHNLAGGSSSGEASFYSKWNLTTDQTMNLLSHAGNFEVSSDKKAIQTIAPAGQGVTDSTLVVSGSGGPLSVAPQGTRTYYGAGSGAVQVLGTYTQISFSVDLYYYAVGNTISVSNQRTNNQDLPEYVAMQLVVPTVVANPQTQVTAINTAYAGTAVLSSNTANGVYSLASNPSHGTVVINADGTFVYTPAAGYTGTDVFTYMLCDPIDTWNCTNSTVTLTIPLANTGFNQLPYVIFGTTILGLGIFVVVTGRVARRRTTRNGATRH